MDTQVNLFPLGKTFYGPDATIPASGSWGTSVGLEGQIRKFKDMYTPTEAAAAKVPYGTLRSQNEVTAILVRNASAISLFPGLAVTWKSGYRGTQVDGYSVVGQSSAAAVAGEAGRAKVAGIVDPHLTKARAGDLFWLIVKGPCLCKGNSVAAAPATVIGDYMAPLIATGASTADFSTTRITDSGALAAINVAGTVANATATTDGTLFNTICNRIGVALSAASTKGAVSAASGNDIPILVDLLYIY